MQVTISENEWNDQRNDRRCSECLRWVTTGDLRYMMVDGRPVCVECLSDEVSISETLRERRGQGPYAGRTTNRGGSFCCHPNYHDDERCGTEWRASVRCMDHSFLHADGYTVDPLTGERRAWAPVVGTECAHCGTEC